MKVLLGLVALLLSACTTVKPVNLADGSVGHVITCNGAAQGMDSCIVKAGEVCGNSGYSVTNQNGEVIPVSLASGQVRGQGQNLSGSFTSVSGARVHRSLFIKCNK